MKTNFIVLFLFLPGMLAFIQAEECVLLVHGLGRGAGSMAPVEKFLKRSGYSVTNIEYPSTKYDVKDLCSLFIHPEIERSILEHDTVHIVTHSLGGILIRYSLQNTAIKQIRKIVMLAPPNRGSEVSDFFTRNMDHLFKAIIGPAGKQLTTGDSGITSKLLPFPYETGIIAGKKSWDPLFSLIIPGPDDGKVSVQSARLNGMKDFLIVNHSHTFIMNSREVHERILSFLKTGKFETNPPPGHPLAPATGPPGPM